jgi:hypothetical protein
MPKPPGNRVDNPIRGHRTRPAAGKSPSRRRPYRASIRWPCIYIEDECQDHVSVIRTIILYHPAGPEPPHPALSPMGRGSLPLSTCSPACRSTESNAANATRNCGALPLPVGERVGVRGLRRRKQVSKTAQWLRRDQTDVLVRLPRRRVSDLSPSPALSAMGRDGRSGMDRAVWGLSSAGFSPA